MNEKQETSADVKPPSAPKQKPFFNREYEFGDKRAHFNLRKARPYEIRLAAQEFNDIESSLSDAEKEDAESEIAINIFKRFALSKEAADDIAKAFENKSVDDTWILRDAWLDYQQAHNSKVVFL